MALTAAWIGYFTHSRTIHFGRGNTITEAFNLLIGPEPTSLRLRVLWAARLIPGLAAAVYRGI